MTVEKLVILPTPKKMITDGKVLDISGGIFVRISEGQVPKKVLETLQKVCFEEKIPFGKGVLVTISRKEGLKKEAYELEISERGICIGYSSEAGVYYAVLTFGQIIRQNEGGRVACSKIFDEPDIPHRGIMMDVSRNRIPTLASLKKIVDTISRLKINQFQLYFEGKPFLYPSFAEHYEKDADVLTAEEIKELDGYCKERFIEFVPNQNCFGHMSEWLDSDAFRHLAECPEGFSYYGTDMPPSTLNPLLKKSIDFVATQFADLLPLFSSEQANIGGDEPFELGEGASKAKCERYGKASVYLDFMKGVFSEVAKYRKNPMMWGDVFKEHYDECKDVFPKDVTVLEWGYNADSFTDEVCELYERAGIKYYLCPGTSLWNTVTGKTDNMFANVKSAARLGKKHGADGVLLVDWGDGGSCQPLVCSLAAYTVGATYFWNGAEEQEGKIVEYLNRFLFEDKSENVGKLIFDLGNYYLCADRDDPNATKIFKALYVQQTDCMNVFEGNYEPLFSNRDFIYLQAEEYERTKVYLQEIKSHLPKLQMQCGDADLYKRELGWAIDYLLHGCKLGELKMSKRQFSKKEMQEFRKEISELNDEYEELWALKNKRTGLKESMLRMNTLKRKYAAICGEE